MKIVVDVYGADKGIDVILSGAADALIKYPELELVMVGPESDIVEAMDRREISADRYEVVNTSGFISCNDSPTCIFEGRDETSMVKALTFLKEHEDADALLSAGNTGALLVGSIFKLGLVKGLKQPALCSAIPTVKGTFNCLVDCGANVECTSKELTYFALMGNAFSQSYNGIEEPRVGLLSVGREKGKGNTLTLETYDKLSELPINFIGNVEGNDLVSGYCDVIVTDGYAGNILLKNTESVGLTALGIVYEMSKNYDADTKALIEPIANALWKMFDLNNQGGATFLGTKKTIVKMHGAANENTVVACIEQIMKLEKSHFAQKVEEAITDYRNSKA